MSIPLYFISPIFPIDISPLICYAKQRWLVVANWEGFYFDISMDQSGIGAYDIGAEFRADFNRASSYAGALLQRLV